MFSVIINVRIVIGRKMTPNDVNTRNVEWQKTISEMMALMLWAVWVTEKPLFVLTVTLLNCGPLVLP